MGLFDTVYIDPRILEDNKIHCPKCNSMTLKSFQTKDFDNAMESYYFGYDDNKVARLYKLDPPSDKRFWHTYTPEEIQKMRDKEKGENGSFLRSLNDMWIENGGHWVEEAHLPKNRRKRNMGELPHQICSFYEICNSCHSEKYDPKTWIEIQVKFTDGVAVSIKQSERDE